MPAKLKYHWQQSKLYRTKAKYPIVCAGRGSGKTEIARRFIVRKLGEDHPNVRAAGDIPRYFYGLPTYGQAKRVAWEQLKSLVPKEWHQNRSAGRTFYESDLKIVSKYGVELHVVGLDAPQRIEGNQWCGGVLDESSDQQPKVFELTVQPALTAFDGWCWRIGVPKRFGVGAEDFQKAFVFASTGVDPDYEAYTWTSDTVVSAEKLAKIQAVLDARDYNEQYRASWEQASGAIFYAYNEIIHSSTVAEYNPTLKIIVGSDFNVDPMCWVLCHEVNGRLYVFDELKIRNTNTQETLDILHHRYGHHPAGWEFFGDAASKARKTSASQTDYVIILNDKRFTNKKVYYFDSNPPVVDRFAACNALLMNARGDVRCFINPRCTQLISDLKHRSFKQGTREPNDVGDRGHMSDGWGYIIYRKFPLTLDMPTPPVIII